MIGTIIVNSSNEIIQSFGNIDFCAHLKALVCDNPTQSANSQQKFSSSSSGISSCCESSLNKQSLLRATSSSKTKVDDEALLSFILPLLAMYQSRKDSENNEISLLYSDEFKFSFQVYDSSHFIIVISSNNYDEAEIEEFSKNVKSMLMLYYGPFLHFIKADLSSVKRKRSKVEKNMELLIFQLENGNLKYPMLNVNALYVNCHKYQVFMPQFRKIIDEITNAIGHCRCIFVSSGQIIASVCSKTKRPISLIDLLDASDINNLVQMCQIFDQRASSTSTNNLISSNITLNDTISTSSSKKRLKHHFEQIWVHFRNSSKQKRQFVNAFLFSLSSEIDLICLNAIDQSTPIHLTCDLLDLLEEIENVEDKTTNVTRIGEFMQELEKILGTFKPKYCSKETPYMFLENIQRTNLLLKNLWSRLNVELSRPRGISLNDDKKRSFSALFSSYSPYSTINRWGSSVSLFSSSSQRSSSANVGGILQKSGLPIQTIAMNRHFQRQLRLLLNEFCIHSNSVGKYNKFKQAESAMRRVMDRCMSQNLQPLFSKSAKELFDKNEINPAKLGFDMIGYVFYRLDAPFNIFSYPSQYGKSFLNLHSNQSISDIFVGRLESGELLIKFTGALSSLSPPKNISKDLLDFPISCAAIFPSPINSQLAIRQTFSLALTLNRRIKIITSMFE